MSQLNMRMQMFSMIDMSKIPRGKVGLGSEVVVLDLVKDEEITYRLGTSEETDVSKGFISTTSPIGKGLLGKVAGDVVKILIPGGVKELEIRKLTTVHDLVK